MSSLVSACDQLLLNDLSVSVMSDINIDTESAAVSTLMVDWLIYVN
jgi:hypothetical protein